MNSEQIAQVPGGVVLLPMTAGEIVLAYNLPGLNSPLKLPRDVYPEIFLGKVTQWNDPRIVAANPGVTLPNLPITVVRRSDASGTTFVFTKHLSAISPAFREKVGFGHHSPLAAKRQARRRAEKRQHDHHHQADAGRDRLHRIRLCEVDQSRHGAAAEQIRGQFVAPGDASGAAALASAEGREVSSPGSTIPNRPESYPIVSFTWLLLYKKQDPQKAEALRKLVAYGLTDGQKLSDRMGYIPLPKNVIEKVTAASAKVQ